MELKVWVEGIQRIVCGVTVNTTCQDVVFALAHATGKVGRFTLIERWRNNERLLAPNENPLKLLLKWGEYANDVQFILQRSESKQQQQQQQHMKQQETQQQQQHNTTNNNNNSNNINNNNNNESTTVMLNKKPLGLSNINNNNNSNLNKQNSNNNNSNNINNTSNTIDNALNATNTQQQQLQHQQQPQKPLTMELSLNAAHERAKELKKSFGAVHDTKYSENIGIVKGIPQRNNNNISNNLSAITNTSTTKTTTTTSTLIPRHEKSHSNPIEMPSSASNNAGNGLGNFDINSTSSYKGNGAYQEHNNIINNNNNNNNSNNIYQQLGAHNSKSINEINLAEVRNALDRRNMLTATTNLNAQHTQNNNTTSTSMGGSAEIIFTNNTPNNQSLNNSNQSNENLLDIFNGNTTNGSNNSSTKFSNSPNDLYKQATTISANGALVPPPYRDPPPPRNSPLQQQLNVPNSAAATVQATNSNFSSQSVSPQHPGNALYSNQPISPTMQQQQQHQQQQSDYSDYADYQQINDLVLPTNMDESESIFQATQYNDLLQLIKFQREKINQQQMELSKYDAEIVYLESKERDQAQELEAISREITKADQLFRQGSEQLQTLQYVEEENELVKQQEKTLKSEIALLRSKLANCETELLQCKNKVRLLMDDIEIEQRAITNSKQNIRQNVERDFLMEMERIQSEIDQAIHNTDSSNKTAESLKKEILLIETAIAEKKRQVEQLVNEMKEVNLQSLTVTTSEEIKHLLEGSNKPGSSRRIIGSPRQLENAVPTSKNPHGVWV